MRGCRGAVLWAVAALAAGAAGGRPEDEFTNLLPLGILVPLSSEGGGAFMEGQWRSVAVAAVETARQFNARNASFYPAFGSVGDCSLTLDATFVLDTMSSETGAVSAYTYFVDSTDGTAKDIEFDYRHPLRSVIGPARSAEALPVALLGGLNEIPVISYWATSPDLDAARFSTFARTIPADTAMAAALAAVLGNYGWDKVYVLYVSDAYGTALAEFLSDECARFGFTPSLNAFEEGNALAIEHAADVLAHADARVTVIIAFDDDLPAIAAAFEARGLVGAQRVWLFAEANSAAVIAGQGAAFAGAARVASNVVPIDRDARWSVWVAHWRGLDVANFNFTRTAGRYAALEPGYFADERPSVYTSYAIDAVATVALAACALEAAGDEASVANFLDAVGALDVADGVSGHVAFNDDLSRDPATSSFTLMNYRADAAARSADQWTSVGIWTLGDGLALDEPFVFGDGTADTPKDSVFECAGGSYWSDDTQNCVDCPPGRERDGNECVGCTPGRFRSSALELCQRCDAFTYQPDHNTSECVPCGPHSRRYPAQVEDIYMYLETSKNDKLLEQILDAYLRRRFCLSSPLFERRRFDSIPVRPSAQVRGHRGVLPLRDGHLPLHLMQPAARDDRDPARAHRRAPPASPASDRARGRSRSDAVA